MPKKVTFLPADFFSGTAGKLPVSSGGGSAVKQLTILFSTTYVATSGLPIFLNKIPGHYQEI